MWVEAAASPTKAAPAVAAWSGPPRCPVRMPLLQGMQQAMIVKIMTQGQRHHSAWRAAAGIANSACAAVAAVPPNSSQQHGWGMPEHHACTYSVVIISHSSGPGFTLCGQGLAFPSGCCCCPAAFPEAATVCTGAPSQIDDSWFAQDITGKTTGTCMFRFERDSA